MRKTMISIILLISVLLSTTACRNNKSIKDNSSVGEDSLINSKYSEESLVDNSNSSLSEDSTVSSKNKISNNSSTQVTNDQSTVKKGVSKVNYSIQLPGLPGSKSKELLKNPNRGFRLELNFNVATFKIIGYDKDAIKYMNEQLSYYNDDQPQLAQCYFYLTDYSNKDLDQHAFDNLQRYFDALKQNHIQALVRFAYEYNEDNNTVGPTTNQMLRHMKQLKPILEKNKNQIHVIQAGFIGLWGEWHHSVHSHDKKAVLEGIVDMTPLNKQVQVRLVSYKNVLDSNDSRRNRVSYHDDYLVGVDHGWSTANSSNQSEYQMMLNESSKMLVDGEMPWGTDKYYNNGVIDGFEMVKHLQKFHFSTMSVVHNYKEGNMYANYNMAQWKSINLNESNMKSNGFSYAPAWLKDSNNKSMARSLFAYIRDYLGYYVAVNSVNATVNGKSISISGNIQNYGFSAPYGMNKLELVLVDNKYNVISSESLCNLSDLQPNKIVQFNKSIKANELYSGYKIGIRFSNNAGVCAKLANDTQFTNGINTILELQ